MDWFILTALAASLLLNLALGAMVIGLFREHQEHRRADRRAEAIAKRDTSNYFKGRG